MPPDDNEKLNKVEELKDKLFSNTYSTKIQYHDGFVVRKKKDVPESWDKKKSKNLLDSKFFTKTSMFKKIFLFSVGFFILAVGYVGFTLFFGGNTVSNDNIDISIFGNTFTDGGEELPLQIEIINKNSIALDLVDLVVEYPKGSTGDLSQDTERLRTSVGTIPAGSIHNENVKIVLFGEQGAVRPVKVSVEYRIEGSNSIFVKDKPYEVTINSTPVNLSLDAPTEVSPNQDITLDVKATLNSSKPVSGVLVKLDYPVGFVFASASPPPTLGNNVWDLGKFSPGQEDEIKIFGQMVDVFDGEEKTFHVFSGSQDKGDKSNIGVVFNSLAHTIMIQKPFIEAKLYVNGVYQKEYATDSKTRMQGEIRYKNNLDTKLNNVEIRAKIYGNAVNRNSINANDGFYNSGDNIIIWDQNSDDRFAEINPGESGSVSFSLSSLPLSGGPDGLLSDPSINIEVSIVGKQAVEGNILRELKNSESKVIRVISDVGLVAKVLYSTGPFTNTGPIPPEVEKETTYTVSWILTNTSNTISKTLVKSSLPSWIRYVGTVSPAGEDVTYNTATREVVWNAGIIPKGAGITSNTKEVSFQVAFTPSLSQIGSTPNIINETTLTGHDDFANVDVKLNRPILNTRITNEINFPNDGDKVIE